MGRISTLLAESLSDEEIRLLHRLLTGEMLMPGQSLGHLPDLRLVESRGCKRGYQLTALGFEVCQRTAMPASCDPTRDEQVRI